MQKLQLVNVVPDVKQKTSYLQVLQLQIKKLHQKAIMILLNLYIHND
jgi:hypothetical protein